MTTEPSPELLAMGERWADTFADRPLSDAQRAAVGQAYAQITQARKIPVHRVVRGDREAVLMRLGRQLYVVDREQLWVMRIGGQASSDQASLWRAYLRHRRATAKTASSHSQWALSSFTQQMRSLAKAWAIADIDQAFKRAQVAGSHRLYMDARDTSQQRRHVMGYKHREMFYLKCIGTALRQVRAALPKEVISTLWAIQLPSGALAHWALAGTAEHSRRNRLQALRVQPYLLPLSLTISAQLPGVEVDHPEQPGVQALLRAGQALTQAIDEGRPMHEAILAVLHAQGPGTDALHAQVPGVNGVGHLQDWTLADVRFLAGRRLRQTLGYFQAQFKLGSPTQYVALARQLRAHQPRSAKQWAQLGPLLRLGVPPAHMDRFLRGTPPNLTDPFFERLGDQVASLHDVMVWLGGDFRYEDEFTEDLGDQGLTTNDLIQRLCQSPLTWRQWLNISDRAHAIERAMAAAFQDQQLAVQAPYLALRAELQARMSWTPILAHPFVQGQVRVVERSTWSDLQAEGQILDHCVGGFGYAQHCGRGVTRILGVERLTGERVSTVELSWNGARRRIDVVQHQAKHNSAPAADEQRAVQALIRRKDLLMQGPWPVVPDMARLDQLARQAYSDHHGMDRIALAQRLWDDLVHRFPVMAPLRPRW